MNQTKHASHSMSLMLMILGMLLCPRGAKRR